jgi:hypothetical protein
MATVGGDTRRGWTGSSATSLIRPVGLVVPETLEHSTPFRSARSEVTLSQVTAYFMLGTGLLRSGLDIEQTGKILRFAGSESARSETASDSQLEVLPLGITAVSRPVEHRQSLSYS